MDEHLVTLIGMLLVAATSAGSLILQNRKDKSVEKTSDTKVIVNGANELTGSAVALVNAMEARMNARIDTAEARITGQAKLIAGQSILISEQDDRIAEQNSKLREQDEKINELEGIIEEQCTEIKSTGDGVKILIQQIIRLGFTPDWQPKNIEGGD